MNLINWLKERFFYLRLWIGRVEKCYKCGSLIWNRKESLYDSLYWKKTEHREVNLICKSCSKKSKNEVIK
jgi:hypothetical protein